MTISKIAFVAYPVQDPAEGKKFWSDVLGVPVAAEHQGRWIEFDGRDGKTIAVENFSPEGAHPYLALETDDIAAEMARLKELGIEQQGEIMDNKVCKMAFINDPSGHTIMIHQIAPERIKPASE